MARHHPPKPPTPQKPTNDLAAKQKAAMEALKQRREIETKLAAKPVTSTCSEKHQPSPQPKPVPKTEGKKPEGRDERLAALRAKSAATAQFAKEAKDAKKLDEKVESDIKPITAPEPEVEVVIETKVQDTKKSSVSKGAANVFKTIKTEVKKSDRKQKRRRSNDKKGGGSNHNQRNSTEESISSTSMLQGNC